MNRRGFFASVSAFVAVMAGHIKASPTWGFVDVERCVALRRKGINLRTHFNGEDVTKRCFQADDRTGTIGLFKLLNGRPYYDRATDDAAREFLHGKVEFIRK